MNKMLINLLALFVIALGSVSLALPDSSYATADSEYTLLSESECECANGDTCSGPCCECTALGCSAGECD